MRRSAWERRPLRVAGALVAVAALAACGRDEPASAPAASPSAAASPAPAAEGPTASERGRRLYVANCTACHNNDPALPGALGPEVAGASRELLEARILRAEYPPGYTPKRSSRAMVALPHLKDGIGDLTAYLASAPKS